MTLARVVDHARNPVPTSDAPATVMPMPTKQLTPADLARAHEVGMDDSETEHHEGTRSRVMPISELWTRVMGDASRADYPAQAVADLRSAYDHGRRDFW